MCLTILVVICAFRWVWTLVFTVDTCLCRVELLSRLLRVASTLLLAKVHAVSCCLNLSLLTCRVPLHRL